MKDPKPEFHNVNLLWTGGWDSTFQLLQLLIINKQVVTPFYLIHAPRPSLQIEILTMNRIKDHVFKEYPFTRELLKPTKYFSDNDIVPDTKITKAYNSIRKTKHLGIQYEWLARFCKEKDMSDMQLSVEAPKEFFDSDWISDFYPLLKEKTINFQTIYVVDPIHHKKNYFQLFKYFHFPIVKISKVQMLAITTSQGLENIMGMTWFCQNPTPNKKPCGICKPCLQVIKNGMNWRLPLKSRIISFIYTIVFIKIKSQLRVILINFGLYKNK